MRFLEFYLIYVARDTGSSKNRLKSKNTPNANAYSSVALMFILNRWILIIIEAEAKNAPDALSEVFYLKHKNLTMTSVHTYEFSVQRYSLNIIHYVYLRIIVPLYGKQIPSGPCKSNVSNLSGSLIMLLNSSIRLFSAYFRHVDSLL